MEYVAHFEPDIVVLDFDMSWHKGSDEKDVVFESRDDFGYLAPEQTTFHRGVSARSTRVDSYGLGMTLYCLFGNEQPRANEGLSEGWFEKALHAASRQYEDDWKSAPHHLARLIVRLTKIDQTERVDFIPAVRELELIAEAVLRPTEVGNASMVAEECLAHTQHHGTYTWDDDMSLGVLKLPSGLLLEVKGDIASDMIYLMARYTDIGVTERATLSRRLSNAAGEARKKLASAGWTITADHKAAGQALLRAEIPRLHCLAHRPQAFYVCGDMYRLFSAALT